MAKLTERQKRFCDEYMIDLNATKAAMRAGYSEKTANEQGARLLANVSVREQLDRLLGERREQTKLQQYRVLRELSQIGFANVDLEAVKPSEKLKALEMLMKHLGMLDKGNADAGAEEAGVVILPEPAGGEGDG